MVKAARRSDKDESAVAAAPDGQATQPQPREGPHRVKSRGGDESAGPPSWQDLLDFSPDFTLKPIKKSAFNDKHAKITI